MQGHRDGRITVFHRSVLGIWALFRCSKNNGRFVRVEKDSVIVRARGELKLTGTLAVVTLEGQLLVVEWTGKFRRSLNRRRNADAERECSQDHGGYDGEQQEKHRLGGSLRGRNVHISPRLRDATRRRHGA